MSKCNCISLLNKQLEPRNTVLNTDRMIDLKTGRYTGEAMRIETRKLNAKIRTSAVALHCAYCPVCGRNLKGDDRLRAAIGNAVAAMDAAKAQIEWLRDVGSPHGVDDTIKQLNEAIAGLPESSATDGATNPPTKGEA